MIFRNSTLMSNQEAVEWIGSTRGRFVLVQALQAGIKELGSVRPRFLREANNIRDMEVLLRSDFLRESVEYVNISKEFQKNKYPDTLESIPSDWMGEEIT